MARSEVNKIYDAETAFRAPGSAPVTASSVIGTLALDKLDKVRPSSQRNKLGAEKYEIVIAVSDLAGTGTYEFDVEVGAAGAAATKVGSVVVASTGQYILSVDAATVEKLDADREEIELNLTAGGTTPSITFAAWLV